MARLKIASRRRRGKDVFVVDLRYVNRGGRHFFPTRTAAEEFVAATRQTLAKEKDRPLILTGAAKRDHESAKDILGTVPLVEAALHYKKTCQLMERKSMGEALVAFTSAKTRANKSKEYVNIIEARLTKLKLFLQGKISFVDEVSSEMIEEWLHLQAWGDYTKNRALIDVQTFFNFCERQRWRTSNPVANVEKIEAYEFEKGILTPAQARVLMQVCARHDPKLVRYFADQLFGFMREREARLLRRDQVKQTFVEIKKLSGRPTKTGEIGYVDLNPTWLAWLNFSKGDYWPIVNWDERARKIKRLAREQMLKERLVTKDWWFPQNCLRHSACSYGAVKFGPGTAARYARHSEAIQGKNYRRPISEMEAKEFWEILPEFS